MDSMRAVVFDGRVKLDPNHPVPGRPSGWASIRVRRAGICGTDLELVKGYMGYRGVLGHEFVGTVEEADDPAWRGRRVVGEINAACGACSWCEDGLRRHCPSRTVLGIMGLDGCMAERCVLPTANLHVVPDDSSDDRAVFLEPLSAAHEILEQVPFHGDERVVVLGDGKLGILCAWTLATAAGSVTLVGHHASKLEAARWGGLQTALGVDDAPRGADVVVEATGTAAGLGDAIGLCRPRGTLVLKSTVATRGELDLAPVVIHEISVVGSRCGPFERGIAAMREQSFPVERLVADRYPLAEAERAFERAATRGVLKVLLEPEASS